MTTSEASTEPDDLDRHDTFAARATAVMVALVIVAAVVVLYVVMSAGGSGPAVVDVTSGPSPSPSAAPSAGEAPARTAQWYRDQYDKIRAADQDISALGIIVYEDPTSDTDQQRLFALQQQCSGYVEDYNAATRSTRDAANRPDDVPAEVGQEPDVNCAPELPFADGDVD